MDYKCGKIEFKYFRESEHLVTEIRQSLERLHINVIEKMVKMRLCEYLEIKRS